MNIKICFGQRGADITDKFIGDIREKHRKNPHQKLIMAVPSNYSHETEKLMIENFGGTGINNIEAVTLEKLARSYMGELSNELTSVGRQVLVSRAIDLCLKEISKEGSGFGGALIAAVGKSGFVSVAEELTAEFHRYLVTSEMLFDIAERMDERNDYLKQKLKISAIILRNYETLLGNIEYVDASENLTRLAEAIGEEVSGRTYYFDKFDELTPQQLAVISALVKNGAEVNVGFITCGDVHTEGGKVTSLGENTYHGVITAVKRLREIADLSFDVIEDNGGGAHEDLEFLYRNWYNDAEYGGSAENITVTVSTGAQAEMEHIASEILRLVKDDSSLRYRDIAVFCGDMSEYEHILESVFNEYDIPFYADIQMPVAEHPVAMQILSLFDILEKDWSKESVFAYLRAGYIYEETERDMNGRRYTAYPRISSRDIDSLENYVLKYGVRGKSAWSKDWITEKDYLSEVLDLDDAKTPGAEYFDKINSIRKRVVAPVLNFSERLKRNMTVHDYCTAVYDFLNDINMYNGIKSELMSKKSNIASVDSARLESVWTYILQLLDQLNTALGKEVVKGEEFIRYMRAAMLSSRIRTIPSGIDRVFIGNVSNNNIGHFRILFAAGAVSGTYPLEVKNEGFLSDGDRAAIATQNVVISPDTRLINKKKYYDVYRVFTSATDKIFISYPNQTLDGTGKRICALAEDIARRMNIDIRYADESGIKAVGVKRNVIHRLLNGDTSDKYIRYAEKLVREDRETDKFLNDIKAVGSEYEMRNIKLSPSVAERLYGGRIEYSASRLNKYAECPFAYFLKYGLKVYEREEQSFDSRNTGTFVHEVMRNLCDEGMKENNGFILKVIGFAREMVENIEEDKYLIGDKAETLKALREQTVDVNRDFAKTLCGKYIDSFVEKAVMKSDGMNLRNKKRMNSVIKGLGRRSRKIADNLVDVLIDGEFRICESEKKISIKLTDEITLVGSIDRLDMCEYKKNGGTGREYRIIDYKTGVKTFKIKDVYNRIDMQPVIYALAVMAEDAEAELAGMYYSEARDEFAEYDAGKLPDNDEEISKDLNKNTELNGVAFVKESGGGLDDESLDRIEKSLKRVRGKTVMFKKGLKPGEYLRTREESVKVMEYVRNEIIDMHGEIKSGRIGLEPYNDDCTYCIYKDVCSFDEKMKKPRMPHVPEDGDDENNSAKDWELIWEDIDKR